MRAVQRASGQSSLAVPKLNWADEEMSHIYSSWAKYFFKKDPERTEYCFDKCLELDPYDASSLFFRSAAKRDVAHFDSALLDALAAANLQENKPQFDYGIYECYDKLTQFENSKVQLSNNGRKYGGFYARKFAESEDVTTEYLKDCLGPALEVFIKKHKTRFPEVVDFIEREKAHDPRPRWKKLREQNKCDVVSVDEKEQEFVSPLERARRERWYRIFNQIYFGRNWVDKIFLRDLLKNEELSLPYFLESAPLLKEILVPNNEAVKKFIKILHARSPLYVEQLKRFGNPKLAKRHSEAYLFGQQYKARRKMFNAIRIVKELRQKGKIEAMSKYIEDVMSNFVNIKTNRIMPRKFEFINEIYNTLALAHCDWYIRIEQHKYYKDFSKRRLQRMVGVYEEPKVKSGFVFGDRSTYASADAVDPKLAVYKKFLEHIENRLIFAKYPIERAYLWHEIARTHLKQRRYGESQTAARNAVHEAQKCNSNIYIFLSQMAIVKAFAAQYKIEYLRSALSEAADTAYLLGDLNLISFVENAISMADADIESKRSTATIDFVRRRTGTTSGRSTLSTISSSEKTTTSKSNLSEMSYQSAELS